VYNVENQYDTAFMTSLAGVQIQTFRCLELGFKACGRNDWTFQSSLVLGNQSSVLSPSRLLAMPHEIDNPKCHPRIMAQFKSFNRIEEFEYCKLSDHS
jgi:hypothetical protein